MEDLAAYRRRGGRATTSGNTRGCFTISPAPRKGLPLTSEAPPSTKYSPNFDVSSTRVRAKGGSIAPLPTTSSRLKRGATPSADDRALSGAGGALDEGASRAASRLHKRTSPTPDFTTSSPPPGAATSWHRPHVARDDEAGLVAAIRSMQVDKSWTAKRVGRFSPTPVDRSWGARRLLGTATETPPPGRYDVPLDTMGSNLTGGRLSRAKRFDDPIAREKAATPGPASYCQATAPKRNTRGVDFSKAPGGRCMDGATCFVAKRTTTAASGRAVGTPMDLPSRDTPGPGTYDTAMRAAFREGNPHELSPVASAFLAQRIPFDAAVATPALVSDIVHVRNVADELARHKLRV